MRTALTAKFTRNENLKGFLKAKGKKTLVEANAFDKFWGWVCHLETKTYGIHLNGKEQTILVNF